MAEPELPAGATTSIRVYDAAHVDAYVARLHEHLEELNEQIASMRRAETASPPDGFGAAEPDLGADSPARIVGRAVLEAQQIAEDAERAARRERDDLLARTERECRDRLEASEREAKRTIDAAHREAEAVQRQADATRLAAERAHDLLLESARREAERVRAPARADVEDLSNANGTQTRSINGYADAPKPTDTWQPPAPATPITAPPPTGPPLIPLAPPVSPEARRGPGHSRERRSRFRR